MKRVLKWLGVATLSLVGLVLITAAVFWFTIPPVPTLPDDTALAAPDTSVSKPALRAELLRMSAIDQAVRKTAFESDLELESLGGLWRLAQQGVRLSRVDGPNIARLKEIVAEHGWPTREEVGEDGRKAVFFIVQHADRDPAFQKQALEPMRQAYEAGDATGHDLARLTDRVQVAEGRDQRYGTQLFMMRGQPAALRPIEDSANVDARRAALGLPPLAVYLDEICAERQMCVDR